MIRLRSGFDPSAGSGLTTNGISGLPLCRLQRSPTYTLSRPSEDALANRLRRILPAQLAYGLIRWRNVLLTLFLFSHSKKSPERMKRYLINQVRKRLGPDYDVAMHFTPSCGPWDQRLCLVPDDDFFAAIKSGSASIVTDHIDTFTPEGIRLKSGQVLAADMVITATGLVLEVFNGIAVSVDGKAVVPAETFMYRGMMYNDVPNLATSFGYTNASWTLRADLTSTYVCRLLNHMDKTATRLCTPRRRNSSASRRDSAPRSKHPLCGTKRIFFRSSNQHR